MAFDITKIRRVIYIIGLAISGLLFIALFSTGQSILFILPFALAWYLFKSDVNHKKITNILVALYLPATVVASLLLRTDLNIVTWDFSFISHSVMENVGHSLSQIGKPEYFQKYPFLAQYTLLMKFLAIVSVKTGIGFSVILAFLGAVCVWISYLCIVLTVKNQSGDKAALVVSVLWWGTLVFWEYAPLFYSDIITMPFIAGAMYFFSKSIDGSAKKKVLWFIIVALVLALAFLYKSTAAIPGVAMLIYLMVNGKWKSAIVFCVLLVVMITGVTKVSDYMGNKTGLFTYQKVEKNGFPILHWVNMSFNPSGNGGYVTSDVVYTFHSGNNHKEKNEKLKEAFVQRLKNMGLTGILDQMIRKTHLTWGNGDLAASYYVRDKEYEAVGKLFDTRGKYNFLVTNYNTGVWLLYLISLIVSVVCLYKNKIRKENMIFLFSIVGIAVFELFWEANSRYLLNFLPFFVALSSETFVLLIKHVSNWQEKKNGE